MGVHLLMFFFPVLSDLFLGVLDGFCLLRLVIIRSLMVSVVGQERVSLGHGVDLSDQLGFSKEELIVLHKGLSCVFVQGALWERHDQQAFDHF
jgi:hypothetical protein